MIFNRYRSKRVLVTGHTGFKGSWLSSWLLQLGARVAGFSLPPHSPSHFALIGLEKRLHADFRGDIRSFSEIRRCVAEWKPDLVFHLAAEALVNDCFENPIQAFETNTLGSIHLMEAAKNGPAIVMITSDKCYENQEWEQGYRENDRLGGKDPYSASKAAAELAIACYAKSYGIRVASARAGNVIGGGDFARGRIVPDSVRARREQKALLLKSPESTRPWQHVLEPLYGYLLLGLKLLEGKCKGEAYNFGPAASHPVEKLVAELQKNWGDLEVVSLPLAPKHEAKRLSLCCDKAKEELGWSPPYSFEEAVRLTAEWYEGYFRGEDLSLLTERQIAEFSPSLPASARSPSEISSGFGGLSG